MNISPWNAANIDSHRHYGHIFCSLMDFLPLFFSETYKNHTLTHMYNIRFSTRNKGIIFYGLPEWFILYHVFLQHLVQTSFCSTLCVCLGIIWFYIKKTLTIKSCTCTYSHIFNMSLSFNYRVISVLFFIENDNNIVPISFCFTQ